MALVIHRVRSESIRPNAVCVSIVCCHFVVYRMVKHWLMVWHIIENHDSASGSLDVSLVLILQTEPLRDSSLRM